MSSLNLNKLSYFRTGTRYFSNVSDDAILNIMDVRMRAKFRGPDGGEMEIDVLAESDCGGVVLVEAKKTKEPVGVTPVGDFMEKAAAYTTAHSEKRVVMAFFSVGGFTKEATAVCKEKRIVAATRIELD